MAHARLLAESDANLPPILVNRRTMRVIDGMHRVLAATLRGRDEIEVQFLDCDDEEAFILAVESNVAHGLPLTLADRVAAAKRIIASHPEWSDRAVASVTGLAHKTVGSIRRRLSGEIPQSNTRRGLDGRVRPVDAAQGRREASRLLADRPGASLREIAREAGVCAATVRDVRARLERGEGPLVPRQRESASQNAGPSPRDRRAPGSLPMRAKPSRGSWGADGSALIENLRKDPSLRFSESGRQLLRLLCTVAIEPQDWNRLCDNVPPHCTDVVATAARICAQAWQQFATELEQRRGQKWQSSG
ncbi:MAG TPA: ParB N-terminal domain-containing protein [Micromonosporaceae bacterium]|nr:ParB N-terminal domain-containing protein [Micromonosporaceae bacterium]